MKYFLCIHIACYLLPPFAVWMSLLAIPFLLLVCRYYAICCQPLVYQNKMTPMRVALMIGGCWVIPTFISFLPIMQGWNSIGIDHLVSTVVCVHVCVCVSTRGKGSLWSLGLFFMEIEMESKKFCTSPQDMQVYDGNTQLLSENGVAWRGEKLKVQKRDKH